MKIYKFAGKANTCGTNIKKYRKQKRITQSDLAARLQSRYDIQLEQKAISRIEMSERFISDYELRAISRILEVDVDTLFEGTELE